jgi:hypothetical protein
MGEPCHMRHDVHALRSLALCKAGAGCDCIPLLGSAWLVDCAALSNPGQRAHARCTAAEYVEQKLRFQSADWFKLPRKELWAAVVASSDADLKKMVDCIIEQAGWPRNKVAVFMAQRTGT